jgi:hypothetical protein
MKTTQIIKDAKTGVETQITVEFDPHGLTVWQCDPNRPDFDAVPAMVLDLDDGLLRVFNVDENGEAMSDEDQMLFVGRRLP